MRSERPVRDAVAIVAIGIVFGLLYNQIGLARRSPHALAWIGHEHTLASVEGMAAGTPGAADSQAAAPGPQATASGAGNAPATPAAPPLQGPSHPLRTTNDPGHRGNSPPGSANSPAPAPTSGAAPTPAPATPPVSGAPAGEMAARAALPVIPDVPGPLRVEMTTVQKFVAAGAALVIDAREAGEYAEGHIPGAISIPYEEAGGEPDRLQKLDAQGRPIIVYCSGGTCESSRMLADMLVSQFGKRRVLVYEGGFPEWQAAGNPVAKGNG